jgi:hypothetical protein
MVCVKLNTVTGASNCSLNSGPGVFSSCGTVPFTAAPPANYSVSCSFNSAWNIILCFRMNNTNGSTSCVYNSDPTAGAWESQDGAKRLPWAETDLDEAFRLIPAEDTLERLFIRKWKAVLEAFRKNQSEPLMVFQNEAREFGDSESVREMDLFICKFSASEHIYNHLYFGTPFTQYRERICIEVGRKPQTSSFVLGDSGGVVLDLASVSLAKTHPAS